MSDNNNSSFEINDREFKLFQDLVYQKTNITMNDTKKLLIVSRLSKRLRVLKLKSFKEYHDFLQRPENEDEVMEFINQITTNKTDFFREKHHFDFLEKTYLPDCLEKGKTVDIRIWSAGSSIGCEVYTIAMVIKKFCESRKVNFGTKLLATDLDTSVLAKGKAGVYQESYVEAVPADYKGYFKKLGNDEYEVSQQLKDMIQFKKLNLFETFPFKQGFDVIFCRNVMIYFNRQDQERLVEKFYKSLRNDGYLIIGHSESILSKADLFKNIGKTIYKKI